MERMPFSANHAHERAMQMSMEEVVRALVDLLGLTTVAVLGGVKETRAVNQWMAGREPQRPDVLRFALQLAFMLSTLKGKSVARAWFQGTNPRLEGRSPAILLHNRPTDEVKQQILSAAEQFAARELWIDPNLDHSGKPQ